MPLGLYISVPFCRTKCTYCNFASDVFSRAVFEKYIFRVCDEISSARGTADQAGGVFDRAVDSIYFGGGTPTLLDVAQLERVFVTIRQNFDVQPDAEITVECAPGTLSQPMVEALIRCGVNRVSLGVQSFVDQESASVGRLHRKEVVLDDVARLRAAGISNINVDLIAGLPHQTRESWEYSLTELIATGVPHASVYMLEVDEDSRLGRELLAGGQKYHAHFVPDEDLTADFYEIACERLNEAGIQQYEISNFARESFDSKHNLKYWTRQPYLGFGVDAHSMLVANAGSRDHRERDAQSVFAAIHGLEDNHERDGHDFQSCRNTTESTDGTAETDTGKTPDGAHDRVERRFQRGASRLSSRHGAAESRTLSGPADVGDGFSEACKSRPLPATANAVRFANPENLDQYLRAAPAIKIVTSPHTALQEAFFLGLRMNRGVSLDMLKRNFGEPAVATYSENISELIKVDLLVCENSVIRLTGRGRLLSNEVFERFVSIVDPAEYASRL